jgi:hypothetical protein
MRTLAALLVLALGACKYPVPLYCDEDTPCTDPSLPFCDLNGQYPASEFIGKTCIPYPWDAAPPPVSCGEPGATLRCEASQLVVCGEDGFEASSTCPLGCHDEELRCNDVDPSNGLAEYLDAAASAPAVDLSDGATINTVTGEIRDGAGALVPVPSFLLPAPQNGVPIRVFAVSAWRSGEIEVIASDASAPALAIVSRRDLVLHGFLNLAQLYRTSAGSILDVANPCRGKSGGTTTVNGHIQSGGDGGAGNSKPGGRGGFVENATSGGQGGEAFVNPDLVPLRGGCPGGPTASGGGAVQLVSNARILVDGSGRPAGVDASGAGGYSSAQFEQPGGGGSGGGVLLEAPITELIGSAILVANGGGGGAYHDGDASPGLRSTFPAPGAPGQPPRYGNGGSGGTNSAPTDGQTVDLVSTEIRVAGGGGGAAGYIRINTADGSFTSTSGAVVSPTASTATIVPR